MATGLTLDGLARHANLNVDRNGGYRGMTEQTRRNRGNSTPEAQRMIEGHRRPDVAFNSFSRVIRRFGRSN